MRVVLQRVREARVDVDGQTVGAIQGGLLLLLGIARGDGPAQVDKLAAKIPRLRIFDDQEGRMNRSLLDVGGAILVVSQFTLLADTRKGRRPSYVDAMPPDEARPLVEAFVQALEVQGLPVAQGVFGAHMAVHLVNDGPVTLILEA